MTFSPWTRIDKAAQFVRGFYPTWDDDYAERLIRQFQLNWNDRIHTLSFGSKMKVSLMLTLAWRPRVLVLDEPTVGLDAISKQQVFAELLTAVRDDNRTVLISSHSLSDLERLTDYVGMIKNGRMLFEGTTSDVMERYRMVDVIAAQPVDLRSRAGVVVQTNEGSRWRLLVDRRVTPVESLGSLGLTLVSDGPVSLEDLFVALGKD